MSLNFRDKVELICTLPPFVFLSLFIQGHEGEKHLPRKTKLKYSLQSFKSKTSPGMSSSAIVGPSTPKLVKNWKSSVPPKSQK
jgi:hypothetical protein